MHERSQCCAIDASICIVVNIQPTSNGGNIHGPVLVLRPPMFIRPYLGCDHGYLTRIFAWDTLSWPQQVHEASERP